MLMKGRIRQKHFSVVSLAERHQLPQIQIIWQSSEVWGKLLCGKHSIVFILLEQEWTKMVPWKLHHLCFI